VVLDVGYDFDEVFDVDWLVVGEDVFFVVIGVIDGELF